MRRLLRAFRRSNQGTIAITTAFSSTVLIGFAALAINVSSVYYAKRKQQTATDLAAIAAAANLPNGLAAASSSAVINGFAPADIASVEAGYYTADPTLAPGQRFSLQGSGTTNAVRVTMKRKSPYYFGTLFNPGSGALVTTQATASSRNLAAFAIGSGLLSLNNGIVNGLLGGLLGTNLSLSVMDYQALASANVNLFAFSNALATRLNLTAVTYNSLVSGSASLPTVLAALADALQASGQSPTTIRNIVTAISSSRNTVPLGKLVDFGPYGTTPTGSSPAIGATVSALDLVYAMVQAANGSQQVATAINVGLPGIASINASIAIGEPAVGSSFVAVGATGATLTTAQTRIRLDLSLLGVPPASLLQVPLVLNIASATATLQSVECSAGAPSQVGLGVTPGLVDLWIGSIPDTTLQDFTHTLNPPAATLLNVLGLIRITAYAHAQIANTSPTTVNFSASDISAATRKTVSTTDFLAPLLSSLFGSIQLSTTILGITPINVNTLNGQLVQLLLADSAVLDTLLASVLSTLGISVGNATVWVSGVRCGQSVLVN